MQCNYSVVVPYRDKFELFVKAVDSIPDREDIQIIIVDNAPESLRHEDVPYKQKAKVTYTTSSPTKGAGCARNEGLKHVLGNFIIFLDADDFFTPNAFSIFDQYLDESYDIVFFKPTSIKLSDGQISDRHKAYSSSVDMYLNNHDERRLRYRWEVPWSKLFSANFVISGEYKFDELKVNNDAWFSLMTGHNAKAITADSSVVYVVTEGASGQSLVKKVNKENAFIRYIVAIRTNKFLKSVGRYEMHIRLLGFIRKAFKLFGFKECLRYLKVAYDNKTSIF